MDIVLRISAYYFLKFFISSIIKKVQKNNTDIMEKPFIKPTISPLFIYKEKIYTNKKLTTIPKHNDLKNILKNLFILYVTSFSK